VDSTSVSGFDEAREGLEQAVLFLTSSRSTRVRSSKKDCSARAKAEPSRVFLRTDPAYFRSFGSRSNVEQTSNFCELGDFERLAISKKLYEIADFEMNTLPSDRAAKFSGG
jgi:hypothetical protein